MLISINFICVICPLIYKQGFLFLKIAGHPSPLAGIRFETFISIQRTFVFMFSFLYFLNNYNSEFLLMCYFQQRPGSDGTLKYSNSWHVVKETAKWDWLLLVLLNLKLQNVQTVLPYHSLMLNIGQILSCLSSIYAFYCVGTWCV